MRYPPPIIMTALTCAAAALGLLAYARDVIPRSPTRAELLGVWVGWVDGGHYFRLKLSGDGTGLCGFYELVKADSTAHLHRVTRWSLNGSRLDAALTPIDADAFPLTITGSASTVSLHLRVGTTNGWSVEPILRRETFIESVTDGTKKRMNDYEHLEIQK